MKKFANLVYELAQAEKADERVDLIQKYFSLAHNTDKMHALNLFSGKYPKRIFSPATLKNLATEKAGIPDWLFEESNKAVGDIAEAAALVLANPDTEIENSLNYWMDYISSMAGKQDNEIKALVFTAWDNQNKKERYIFNKICSGTFKAKVTQPEMIRALVAHTRLPGHVLAHRIDGSWTSFDDFLGIEKNNPQVSKPYPFTLLSPIENLNDIPGNPQDWHAQWKYEGIRIQLIKREGQLFLWSQAEEMLQSKFPEFEDCKAFLPDGTVMEGDIVAWQENKVLPYSHLKARLSKKAIDAKTIKNVPVVFRFSEILEWKGEDLKTKEYGARKSIMEGFLSDSTMPLFRMAPEILFQSLEDLDQERLSGRDLGAEGIILNHEKKPDPESDLVITESFYWKLDPLNVDAVLLYAAKGNGKYANVFSDYTFGLWKENSLVSITKANTGLTDQEILEIDQWVKKNQLEKFGPVRTVKPELVFKIGFQGIEKSTRHKSGFVLKSPVIQHWLVEKPISEANKIEYLQRLMKDSN